MLIVNSPNAPLPITDEAYDYLIGCWRKRLAWQIRRFRRERGVWPTPETIESAKHACDGAALNGMAPTWWEN